MSIVSPILHLFFLMIIGFRGQLMIKTITFRFLCFKRARKCFFCLCSFGVWHWKKLLREMGGKGCSPDGCTYNTIVRGFINNKETSRATRLIQEMLEKGFSADASTMELIVDLLSKDTVDPGLLALLKDSA
ncbi:putative pentatricopeptide [Rosa chinensis]|uniref:Putative pentatricopeptide n=1 Tax=Rosa chinensis TaxID=74649 RepID=A0A2P6QLC8_ROSCH|nr:putative pentatricopeptide [Rosa chinensis]